MSCLFYSSKQEITDDVKVWNLSVKFDHIKYTQTKSSKLKHDWTKACEKFPLLINKKASKMFP